MHPVCYLAGRSPSELKGGKVLGEGRRRRERGENRRAVCDAVAGAHVSHVGGSGLVGVPEVHTLCSSSPQGLLMRGPQCHCKGLQLALE